MSDPNEVKKTTEELVRKLLTEQRLVEKDNTMHILRKGRRDLVVYVSVQVLPSINGVTVAGETQKEYNQWCAKFPAKMLPVTNATAKKAISELAHLAKQAMMHLGMIRE